MGTFTSANPKIFRDYYNSKEVDKRSILYSSREYGGYNQSDQLSGKVVPGRNIPRGNAGMPWRNSLSIRWTARIPFPIL